MNDAYAAGILDGEGCLTVGLTKRVMTYDSRIYVGMTERAKGVLELFRREFGGTLRKSRGATEKWEAAWMWSVSGRGAAAVLARVLPHLVLKQRQGQLLAELEAMKADATDARERAKAVSAAKAQIGRSGREVSQSAYQMHGGMGLTNEMPASHYGKRLTMIDFQLGDAEYHLDRFIAS